MSDTFRKYFKIGESDSGTVIPPTSGQGSSVSDLDDLYLNETENLSDLANAATALVNLGLTATAAELNRLDGTLATVQGNLGLKDGTAALDLFSLTVSNRSITVNKGGTDLTAESAGLIIERPAGNQSVLWNSDGFDFSDGITVSSTGRTGLFGQSTFADYWIQIRDSTTGSVKLGHNDALNAAQGALLIGTGSLKSIAFVANRNWDITGDFDTVVDADIHMEVEADGKLYLQQQLYFDNATGDKISLLDNRINAVDMYGLGVEAGHLYLKTNSGYRWYSGANADAGVSDIMELSQTGDLTLTGTLTGVDATLSSTLNVDGISTFNNNIVQTAGTIGTDNFASQLIGWRGTYAGDWDVRSLFTDELRAKAFTADITQALAGSDFLTRSVAVLDTDFTVPWGQPLVAVDTTNKIFEVSGDHTANVAVSNTLFVRESTGNDATYTVASVTFNGTSGNTEITVNQDVTDATADGYIGKQGMISVEDLPGQNDIAVFTASDWIKLPVWDRTGTQLTIGNAWGLVTGYTDQSDGTQDWTFTALDSGFVAGLDIFKGSAILDFGQSGDGYIERTVLDDQGSPYSQVVTWTGNPIDNKTLKTRTGILDGIANASGAGFYGENTFLTGSLLAGDLTKAGNYLEYASGVLTAKLDAFDLTATNIIIDSALDRAKFGNATNFIDWNAGALSIASTVFDLNATTLVLENTTPKLALGAAADTLGLSSASDTGTYLNGSGHVRIGTTDASGNLTKGFKFDGTNALLEAGNASIGINSGFFGASDILAYSLDSVTIAGFTASSTRLSKTGNANLYIGESLSTVNAEKTMLLGFWRDQANVAPLPVVRLRASDTTGVNLVQMKYDTDSAWGLEGFVAGTQVFGLGSSNFIGGAFFDANDLWLSPDGTKANATFLINGTTGKLEYDGLRSNIYIRSSVAGFTENASAGSIIDDEWHSRAEAIGTGSNDQDLVKIRLKYLHVFGINRIRMTCRTKRTNTINAGLWTFTNTISLTIGAETISEAITTTAYGLNTIVLDVTPLVEGNFYDLEINLRAFLDGDASNTGTDSASSDSFLREDLNVEAIP